MTILTNKIAPDSKKRDGELSRLEACRGVGRDARTETETDGAMRAMWISKNRMLTNVLNRFDPFARRECPNRIKTAVTHESWSF